MDNFLMKNEDLNMLDNLHTKNKNDGDAMDIDEGEGIFNHCK